MERIMIGIPKKDRVTNEDLIMKSRVHDVIIRPLNQRSGVGRVTQGGMTTCQTTKLDSMKSNKKKRETTTEDGEMN